MRTYFVCPLVALLLTLAGACNPPDKSADTDGATTDDSTTGGTTTSTGESSTDVPSTGDTSTAGTSTDATSTGAPTGTGGGDNSSCEALCAGTSACDGSSQQECLDFCTVEHELYAQIGPECAARQDALNACIGALTCEELGSSTECDDEAEAVVSEACVLPACATFCAHDVECGMQTSDEELECGFTCSYEFAMMALQAGAACETAIADYYACYAALPCDQLEMGCEAEALDVDAACGF